LKLTEKRLNDGRWVTSYAELTGTASICIEDNVRTVEHGERDGGFDKYYQYSTIEDALEAFANFTEADEEPDGWIRASPPNFRRRPDGDPTREYVQA